MTKSQWKASGRKTGWRPEALKPKTFAAGDVPVSGRAAANLFCQAAFLLSKGDGEKMKKLLEGVFYVIRPRRGGAFHKTGAECHPDVPGCNWFMAVWGEDFAAAVQAHIDQIRV